jgi:hypothetical protein
MAGEGFVMLDSVMIIVETKFTEVNRFEIVILLLGGDSTHMNPVIYVNYTRTISH